MLVLTRKLQEKIRIGDQVTITVLRMKGKAVRLGIEAPPNVTVMRGELTHRESSDAGSPQPNAEASVAATVEAAVGGSPIAYVDRTEPNWARDTHPLLPAGRNRSEGAQMEVRFARIPRDKAAQILTRSNPGAGGPLRTMLDQRSKAV
jgi:carbon storage regulator